jgi:predicted nucleic acid-binding protein
MQTRFLSVWQTRALARKWCRQPYWQSLRSTALERRQLLKDRMRHRFITRKTMVVPCDEKIAYRAGEINFTQKKENQRLGMLDSLNYAVANVMQCQFVTDDPHFKDFADVIWIGQKSDVNRLTGSIPCTSCTLYNSHYSPVTAS